MGRGRKGFLNQSVKKFNPRQNENIAKIFRSPGKRDEKISLHEGTLEFMKKHEPTRACRFSFVKRLARQNIRHQCFWLLI